MPGHSNQEDPVPGPSHQEDPVPGPSHRPDPLPAPRRSDVFSSTMRASNIGLEPTFDLGFSISRNSVEDTVPGNLVSYFL